MAFSSDDIAALEAAIAKGVLIVQKGDERVQYRSLKEMRETLAMMKAEISGASSGAIRTSRPLTSRGL